MEPVTPNAPSQGASSIADSRSDKPVVTSTYQTPDRLPLVAPPLPVTGTSQIAAVVSGMMPQDPQVSDGDREAPEPERVLKPYGIGMLPETAGSDDPDSTETEGDSLSLGRTEEPATADRTEGEPETEVEASAETEPTKVETQPSGDPTSAPASAPSTPKEPAPQTSL